MRWYIGIALVAFSGVMLWAMLTSESPTEVSTDELALRVQRSVPRWANYQEDLKAQVGSTPLARWEGSPIRARVAEDEVTVAFEVSGAWADYDFALPVLLKDHLGKVYRNHAARRTNSEVEYIFRLADRSEGASIPWVEIAYPHNFQRLAFSDEGTWYAAGL